MRSEKRQPRAPQSLRVHRGFLLSESEDREH